MLLSNALIFFLISCLLRNTKMLKTGICYNYTCKLNANCPKNSFILSKNNSFELYLCNEEEHNHNISNLSRTRNILNEMFLKNNLYIEQINQQLVQEGLPKITKNKLAVFKHRLNRRLNQISVKAEN